MQRVRVWDLPTRLFHWALVVLVVVSFTTGKIGGNAMQYHMWSGYSILALLVFRIVWGFIGAPTSRFSSFVRGPVTVLRYSAGLFRREGTQHLGHNPLGGWSVMLMLASLCVQAGTGLFANDDIATDGPLVKHISKATSDFLTRIHKWNEWVLVALVVVHLAAILFYLLYKRENLVGPMIHGDKTWNGLAPHEPGSGRTLTALVVIALAGTGVWLLVR